MEEITIRSTRAQRNFMEWSRRVADCRSSGLSVARWCSEHSVNPKTYYNWQKKVFTVMIAQKQTKVSDSSLRFVELPPPSNEMQQASEEKRDLIDHIEVNQAEKVNGVWEQRVTIYYNVIGPIIIPDGLPLPVPDVIVNTRRGVNVTYAGAQKSE